MLICDKCSAKICVSSRKVMKSAWRIISIANTETESLFELELDLCNKCYREFCKLVKQWLNIEL